MKNSGIEWIGEIPEDWEVKKVKHSFVRKNEKAMQENPIVLSLARSGVRERDISNNEGQLAESYYNYNPVDVDDLLINPMDLYSGANCSISKVKGVISPAYINLRAKKNVSPVFYDYYFKVQYWMMAFFAHGNGVSFENRWTLNNETLQNYPIVAPSFETQQRIATYLDKKCSKIEETIQNQQQVIEKLKAYKQSLITEAVTGKVKIENGKVCGEYESYKDSGVEWIGKIPSGWILSKFKFISKEIGDGLHGTPTFDESGDIYFLNGTNIGKEKLLFKDDTDRINSLEYEKYKHPLLSKYTIFIALNGATYGKTSFYNNEKVLLGKSAGYITFDKKQNILFLRYYLQSYAAKKIEEISLLGSTIQNLSLYTLNNFSVPLPSEIEQNSIVEYLYKKCTAIDTAIEQKQSLIEKLTEYKKSLIYECVTGKKEVN